jgi:hypothetical protein
MTVFTIGLSYRSRVSTSMAEQCSITLGSGYVVNAAGMERFRRRALAYRMRFPPPLVPSLLPNWRGIC